MHKLLVLLVFSGFVFAKEKAEDKIAEVFVQKIKKTEKLETSEYPIVLKSRANSKIKSPINGVVVTLDKKLGEEVQKGEVLATLQQQNGGFDYKPLKVRAPISGEVTNINVNLGEYVNLGDIVVEVLDPNQIYGRIEIPVRDHELINADQAVKIKLSQLNRDEVKGKIVGVSSAADPMTGTLSGDIELIEESNFPVGIVGEATIMRGKKELILLEESALNYKGEKVYVKVLDDKNIVSNQDVVVGEKEDGKVIILSGLAEDTKVIIRSNGFVAPGDEVKVVREN
jgi:membrane fusion protein (multidrug efflux system)